MKKKGFSWLSLLFAPYYYAGYGKYTKGVIFAIIGFIPLTSIIVNIYAGFRAKLELPIGEQNFKWIPAIAVYLLHSIIWGSIYFMSPAYQNDIKEIQKSTKTISQQVIEPPKKEVATFNQEEKTMLSEVSAVWSGVSDGASVMIFLEPDNKELIINGQIIPVQIKNIDTENYVINLNVTFNGENVVWGLTKVRGDEGTYNLYLVLHDGRQDKLSFVSTLQ